MSGGGTSPCTAGIFHRLDVRPGSHQAKPRRIPPATLQVFAADQIWFTLTPRLRLTTQDGSRHLPGYALITNWSVGLSRVTMKTRQTARALLPLLIALICCLTSSKALQNGLTCDDLFAETDTTVLLVAGMTSSEIEGFC